MNKQEVIKTLAAAVGNKYACASGVIAQIIQEVGWSLNTPKDCKTKKESYNLGNIKGTGPAGSVTILTTEYYTAAQVAVAQKSNKLVSKTSVGNGKYKCKIYDQFKAYHNYSEALDDHLAFLKGPRYAKAGVLKATNPEAFAQALLKAGYATDPNYAKSIISIVNSNDLRKYDKPVNPPYLVVIPNTVYWQAAALVKEYEKRKFKCQGVAVKKYGPGQHAAKNDPYKFVIHTDSNHADNLVSELRKKGYSKTQKVKK